MSNTANWPLQCSVWHEGLPDHFRPCHNTWSPLYAVARDWLKSKGCVCFDWQEWSRLLDHLTQECGLHLLQCQLQAVIQTGLVCTFFTKYLRTFGTKNILKVICSCPNTYIWLLSSPLSFLLKNDPQFRTVSLIATQCLANWSFIVVLFL